MSSSHPPSTTEMDPLDRQRRQSSIVVGGCCRLQWLSCRGGRVVRGAAEGRSRLIAERASLVKRVPTTAERHDGQHERDTFPPVHSCSTPNATVRFPNPLERASQGSPTCERSSSASQIILARWCRPKCCRPVSRRPRPRRDQVHTSRRTRPGSMGSQQERRRGSRPSYSRRSRYCASPDPSCRRFARLERFSPPALRAWPRPSSTLRHTTLRTGWNVGRIRRFTDRHRQSPREGDLGRAVHG